MKLTSCSIDSKDQGLSKVSTKRINYSCVFDLKVKRRRRRERERLMTVIYETEEKKRRKSCYCCGEVGGSCVFPTCSCFFHSETHRRRKKMRNHYHARHNSYFSFSDLPRINQLKLLQQPN